MQQEMIILWLICDTEISKWFEQISVKISLTAKYKIHAVKEA